jgi:hypothetical protein
MQVLTDTGSVISLPFYAGNAFRGQMRDLLADDFIRSMGMVPNKTKPPIALWFFHCLYAGGALEEGGASEKATGKLMGKNGASIAQGIYEMRNKMPAMSLLGCAFGNRILNGRVKVSDFRPVCRQWGFAGSTIDAGDLFEWLYLTRREDYEGHDENFSMIANTEALKSGTVLNGGIDMDMHILPLERSALGMGIELMRHRGFIGADNRRGFGRIAMTIGTYPDPEPYRNYLETSRKEIAYFLNDIGATQKET